MVEKKNDKNVTETVYDTKNTNMRAGSAKIRRFPYCNRILNDGNLMISFLSIKRSCNQTYNRQEFTVKMNVRTAEENVIIMKLSMNQAIQNTPFVKPITCKFEIYYWCHIG